MAEQILKVIFLLSSWRRVKGENGKLFNPLCHKLNRSTRQQSPALYNGALKTAFGPSEMLLPLHTNHLRQRPIFCQVFPGRIVGQSMLPLALCDFFFPSFLFIIVRAQSQGLAISTFHNPLSSAAPYSHRTLVPTPVPALAQFISICWAGRPPPRPRASACPHASEALPGTVFSVAVPGTRYISGPSWWPSSAPSPTPLCLLHIWSGAMSCTSLLCSRFILMVLPRLRSHSFMPALPLEPCPAICLLTTPGSHHPPSP